MKSKTPLLDILPKITQWESIPYAADLMCQNCDKTGFVNAEEGYPNLIGWCETNYGYMAVFECPECGNKFRFHCADPISDIDEFDGELCLGFADKCGNWDELEIKMKENFEKNN